MEEATGNLIYFQYFLGEMAVILLFVSCLALIPNGEANILLVDIMNANVGDHDVNCILSYAL